MMRERDYYDPIYGSYQAPTFQAHQDHSKKGRSTSSTGNVFGRFLKLGKSKSDANGYNGNGKSRGGKASSQQYDLEEDFRVTPSSKSPVERMVYKVNHRKETSKSHSWIYGSVKLPSDLPFGYGHGYSPGGGSSSNNENMHNPRPQPLDYGGMCECTSEFNFHSQHPPHLHPGSSLAMENNNCHACHHTQNYTTVNECCQHSHACHSSQKQYAHVDNTKKFASSVRNKLTWKSLKQVVKKRPTLDVLKKSNNSPRVPPTSLNPLKEEPIYSPEGLVRSNYFFPEKKAFYASCTDVYGSAQHMTASVRVRPKRTHQPWPFPNEFGPVPNYQEEEEIYHSEWDLRQFLPYDVWLAASNNPYPNSNNYTVSTTKAPKPNRHSDDLIPPAINDAAAAPSSSNVQHTGDEAGSSSNNNTNNYPIKNIPSASTIYGQASITRSSILQTDVTAYQLIKSNKTSRSNFPNKNHVEQNIGVGSSDSDDLSDNVISEDPVRIGGQGIYMISNILPSSNPAGNPNKSVSSVHSQSSESNEKSSPMKHNMSSSPRKSMDGGRSDISRKTELKGSPQQQQHQQQQQQPLSLIKQQPNREGNRERKQTAETFSNKLTDSNDSTIYPINNPNNGTVAKTGLKTYLSQPVDSHGLHLGSGNVSVSSSASTSSQSKNFTIPRLHMNDATGSSYENKVNANSNSNPNHPPSDTHSYIADCEFETFEFKDSFPAAPPVVYSNPPASKEAAPKASQHDPEGSWNSKKVQKNSASNEENEWRREQAAAISRAIGNHTTSSKPADNEGSSDSSNGNKHNGGMKKRKLRQVAKKTVLKETIYEEESENSDEWSFTPKQVYAVKIVVSQNVASEYVKPILKKDRVYETPCVDSKTGPGCPALPHSTNGSCPNGTCTDLCGEGQANGAQTTTARSTKKVQFDSSRLVVCGGATEPEDDSDDAATNQDSAVGRQDDWIVEDEISNDLPNTQTHIQEKPQQKVQQSNSLSVESVTSRQNYADNEGEERNAPSKKSSSKGSSVGFSLPEEKLSSREERGSYARERENAANSADVQQQQQQQQFNHQQMNRDVEQKDDGDDKGLDSTQKQKIVHRGNNVNQFAFPSREQGSSQDPDSVPVKASPSSQLQQRVFNLNSLLFNDTTRIRLNQSRPSLDHTFDFNNAPLGMDRNFQGSRGKLVSRLKQSSSFRQPGGSLLRPREPPPPPPIPLGGYPKPSLPSGNPNLARNEGMNAPKLQSTSSKQTVSDREKVADQEKPRPPRTLPEIPCSNGRNCRGKAQGNSRNVTQIGGNLAETDSARINSSSAPARSNPVAPIRNESLEQRVPSVPPPSRSRTLAEKCKSIEKIIAQHSFRYHPPIQPENEAKRNETNRPNHPRTHNVAESQPSVKTPAAPFQPAQVEQTSNATKAPSSNSFPDHSAQTKSSHPNNHNSSTDPKNVPHKPSHHNCAIQSQPPQFQSNSTDTKKYQEAEQNIEIVTKENSVSEIRIYSTPPNLNMTYKAPPAETHPHGHPTQPKNNSVDTNIQEMHYAATDLLYPRGKPSEKVSGDSQSKDSSSLNSKPQSTSVVLIISPKEESLSEEGSAVTETNQIPHHHLYKRTNYDAIERQPDLPLVPSSSRVQTKPADITITNDAQSSDFGKQELNDQTYGVANSTNSINAASNHAKSAPANRAMPPASTGAKASAAPTNAKTANAITAKSPDSPAPATATTKDTRGKSVGKEAEINAIESKETELPENAEPLYDDVINYAARKARRNIEKRYSSFSAPHLFESLNKEISRNAATFTQNLMAKYGKLSVAAGELVQSQPQIQAPLPPPPIPPLPKISRHGSISKSMRSLSEYPRTTATPSSSNPNVLHYEKNKEESVSLYNDIELRDRCRLGPPSSSSSTTYRGSGKSDGIIYDDTLSVISSNYGRAMSDGRANGSVEGEYEEPLYDDVLNLQVPDSDSGVDTADSPPPPLPAQGPPIHLTPRTPMELHALNFSLFPSNPNESKSAMLRKSTESLQKNSEEIALDKAAGEILADLKTYPLSMKDESRFEERSTGDEYIGHHSKEGGARNSGVDSRSGVVVREDKVLDRTRSLLNELSEKLNKLNFGSTDYNAYISKVVVSSSPESSGVEEDYNSSEKNSSLSNSSETTGFDENNRLTAVSKLVSETLSSARGKFLDSMKVSAGSSAPNLSSSKKHAGPGIAATQVTSGPEEIEEPIYEEIGETKQPTSPLYADAFDVKSVFDGASRNEILSFLESLRERLATADTVEEHL